MNTSSPNVLIEGNVSLPDRTEYCQVSIKDGIICDIVFDRQQFSTSNISLRSDQILCPGFIDPQINGGFGKEFKTDEDAFAVVANNIPRYGVTSIVPTITTKRIADYKRHISLLKRNHTNLLNSARILGIHIEGPALNPEKKGAHPRDLLVQPREIDLFEIITPDVLIFTLAPELDGGWELADKCIKSGLKVGLGHTLSDYDDIVRHFNTDSMHIVHVYNGMPDLSGRKPGVSGAALNNPDYYASVIADLVHCDDVIIIDKNRYVKNKSKVMNIIGDPKDKNIIIIDDMIDTAGTICHAAAALKEKGANHVSVMATHPVFSGNAYENLNKEDIDKIIITNTLTIKPELTKVDFIDISEILAENIYQIFSHK